LGLPVLVLTVILERIEGVQQWTLCVRSHQMLKAAFAISIPKYPLEKGTYRKGPFQDSES